jgi:hypothetical protein
MQVPPPKDWQQFERNMRDLFEAHWGNGKIHGRPGQRQHGVDIYGQPDGTAYHGVQCKGRDGNLGSRLTETELRAEMKEAADFKPRLAHFVMATTVAGAGGWGRGVDRGGGGGWRAGNGRGGEVGAGGSGGARWRSGGSVSGWGPLGHDWARRR